MTDDGSGFAPGAPGGLGFASMRGRAASAGGTLTIRSAPGAGTTIRLAVPLHRPARRPANQPPGRPPVRQRDERTSGRAADAVGRARGAARAAGAGAARLGALTTREREVLDQIAHGRSNREIARLLHVSEKTVKTHVSSVLAKLGAQDRTQAALYAVRHADRQ